MITVGDKLDLATVDTTKRDPMETSVHGSNNCLQSDIMKLHPIIQLTSLLQALNTSEEHRIIALHHPPADTDPSIMHENEVDPLSHTII
jgi:hypothetical protein